MIVLLEKSNKKKINNFENDLTNEIKILKEKNNKFEEEISILSEKNNELNNKINEIVERNRYQDEILDAYRTEFQILFFDYKLESQGLLKYFQEMGVEMLVFVKNVCEKYDLDYWLDFGNLLGSVRHKGYIPWDDDLDMGMMRKDFNKFMKVLDNEIMRFDLENNLRWNIDKDVVSNNWVRSFFKIYYFDQYNHPLGAIDIFPYDFLMEKNEDTEELYYEEKYFFHKKIIDGLAREEAEKDYYEKLGLDYDSGPYILPGIDGVRGNGVGEHKFGYYEYEDIFPLNQIKFCDEYFKCPNNPDSYLKNIYGDYHSHPKIIHHHDVVEKMHKIPNLELEFIKEIKKIKHINNTF